VLLVLLVSQVWSLPEWQWPLAQQGLQGLQSLVLPLAWRQPVLQPAW